jgi:hypothetical protein
MGQSLETHLAGQHEGGRALFWHRLRWRALSKHLPRGGDFTLLDIGAGAGLLGEYLAAEFPRARYRFIEPLESLRQVLRQRHGEAADQAGQERYAGMGYVALLDVLEHQERDVEFLSELAGRMDSGATLLLTVPALPLLWSAWDEGLGHFRRYTRESLGAVLEQVPQFEQQELTYLFPEMIPLALYRKLRAPPGTTVDLGLEMPRLPVVLNEALYAAGRVSLALHRFALAGTSLLVVARRR